MSRLRSELKMTRRHGFILSSEWYPSLGAGWMGSDALVIQTKYIESVARLALFREDFDMKLFDSLCVCLNDKPQQLHNLRVWLLHICHVLLDPLEQTIQKQGSKISLGKITRALSDGVMTSIIHPQVNMLDQGTWTPETRFKYFRNKVAKLRIWQDEQLLKQLKDDAQALMDKIATHYDERYEQLCMEHEGTRLSAMPIDIAPSPQILGGVVLRQDDQVDEDLFLAQLYSRAKLLDEAFRLKVMAVVKMHTPFQGPIHILRRTSSGGIGPHQASFKSLEPDLLSVAMIECEFEQGIACVEVHSAPVKTMGRMREKLMEYVTPDAVWPLSANILDPVRVSIVCSGPSQILQILHWFQDSEPLTRLPVCRIKNKFAVKGAEGDHGYRDLKIFVLFTDESELSIIGEIQVHDRAFFESKHKTHRLYKILRAHALDLV